LEDGEGSRARPGRSPGQALEENESHRVLIPEGIHILGALDLLGRHVGRAAKQRAGDGQVLVDVAAHHLGDAEVEQLGSDGAAEGPREEDVLGFEIPVDDAQAVALHEGVHDGQEQIERVEGLHPALAGQTVGQTFTLEELHHEEGGPAGRPGVGDLDDMWMSDPRRCLPLGHKPRLSLPISL
jgi:hypothetical protein